MKFEKLIKKVDGDVTIFCKHQFKGNVIECGLVDDLYRYVKSRGECPHMADFSISPDECRFKGKCKGCEYLTQERIAYIGDVTNAPARLNGRTVLEIGYSKKREMMVIVLR